MKKIPYTQPMVKVAKMEMENPIAYSNTATSENGGTKTTIGGVPLNGRNDNTPEGTHNGGDLGAKEFSFDFNDD